MAKEEAATGGKDVNEVKKTVMKRTRSARFRKAPQAPKRFKSPFMFFSIEKHPEIRQRLKAGNEKNNNDVLKVAKLVSVEWRNLSPEERTVWNKKAEDDKKRFEFERAIYTGPWKIPASKRSKNDTDAPKRPMSAFVAFSKKMRTQVKSENSHLSTTDVSRLLVLKWKEASEEERTIHIKKEAEERGMYITAMVEWRANQKKKLDAQCKQREQKALMAIVIGTTIRPNMPPNGQGYPPLGYSYEPPVAEMGSLFMVGQPLHGVPYNPSSYHWPTSERRPGHGPNMPPNGQGYPPTSYGYRPPAVELGDLPIAGQPLHGVPCDSLGYPRPTSEGAPVYEYWSHGMQGLPHPSPHPTSSNSNSEQYWNDNRQDMHPFVPFKSQSPYIKGADRYNKSELSQNMSYTPSGEGQVYYNNDVGSHQQYGNPYEQKAPLASPQPQINRSWYSNNNERDSHHEESQVPASYLPQTAAEQPYHTNGDKYPERQSRQGEGACYSSQGATYPSERYEGQYYQHGSYQYS